jgi:hypothetical protein
MYLIILVTRLLELILKRIECIDITHFWLHQTVALSVESFMPLMMGSVDVSFLIT